MQESKAKQTDIKMTARKLRRVINLVRGKGAQEALDMLRFMPYFAARVVEKNIKDAIANASEKYGSSLLPLKVAEIYADESTTYKRGKPRAQGRIYRRLKRTAHLTVKLASNEKKQETIKLGQKTHPTGYRVGVIQPWRSTWFGKKKEYPALLKEDAVIRKFLKKKLYAAGISKILIARTPMNVNITLVTAKPGVVVGRGGQGIDELRVQVAKMINKTVTIDVVEVARIDADAQLVAEAIALQLEKRIAFRRAMKQAMQRTMRASGVEGIKVMVSGRLGGAEIARSEWAKEGRIPLQTLRADVDFGFAEADTIMGKIGVKVWVFKGILMPNEKADLNIKSKKSAPSAGSFDEKIAGRRRAKRSRAIETEVE